MSSESYFKVPKEKDFLKIIEDAEDAGVLDKAATAVAKRLIVAISFMCFSLKTIEFVL